MFLTLVLLIWVARVAWTLYKTAHPARTSCMECGRPFPLPSRNPGANLGRVAGQIAWNLATVVVTLGSILICDFLTNFDMPMNKPPRKRIPLPMPLILSIVATMLIFFVARIRLWYTRVRSDVLLKAFEPESTVQELSRACLECRLARLGEREVRAIRIKVMKRLQLEVDFAFYVLLAAVVCLCIWMYVEIR